MAEFTMPSLGADMDEGVLQEWLVRPGDRVRKGEPIAVVETAKSAIEVECFETGTVDRLLVDPGTTVPVGAPLAMISAAEKAAPKRAPGTAGKAGKGTAGEAGRHRPEEAAQKPPEPAPGRQVPGGAVPAPEDGTPGSAGPLVRHLAERSGVDVDTLHGTGPGGRVTRADVERAAAPPPSRQRITPFARRLAGELGVDPASVKGTGKDGGVRAADVRLAAGRPAREAVPRGPVAPAAGAAGPTTMRRAIADLMTRANREIPHYYLSTTVDLAASMAWLREYNRLAPVSERLLPAAMLLKAAARAAREVPELNGFWNEGHFTPGDGVHLGVAVSLRGGGLVAPAIHDADTVPLPELMAGLKDLVHRARSGRLRGSEVADPTLTVTDLGDQGVESVLGVIYPPQVSLVGFGRVVERPCAVDGLLGVRPVVTATLSADHRATDGAVGARFLRVLDRRLQQPEEL
ncbi:2-oxo acid dehydrogenase subunit E2 [Streptomyces meridianus]|uniref:Dihydrolipoamide acetyltransferase component of pyruvate dehydrogenase complex n=1 Tax=Streptomyces meridianus TaxID=2938945 RepID=A0ABT0X6T7_9ACTN|nr:2-oxo acid dehydrogenase subunit E2 [Streptomyces meridianus]MCM2577427.1 2-oxo acid dehydrogenase subunit E2 [Streptomyces meridianus]